MAIKSNKLGPGSLIFGSTGGKEFASQCRTVTLTPETEEEDALPVLSGEELPGDETYTWTIGGTILDDYTMDSLTVWAYENRGERLPFEFIPNDDAETAVAWTGECVIRPIAVGGEVKTRNENDFEFRCVGEPTPQAA
ncbi:MAG TPA: hypothetical protein VFC95_01900 [Guyparkeria sp.]|nr:hypothetical protein [Guyparkeria sp.]